MKSRVARIEEGTDGTKVESGEDGVGTGDTTM